MGVHHGPPHVAIQGAPVLNPVPGQVGLGQSRLQQVLSIGEIPRQEVSGSQQGPAPRGDVVAELEILDGRIRLPGGLGRGDQLSWLCGLRRHSGRYRHGDGVFGRDAR
jgi:hypothetical protein